MLRINAKVARSHARRALVVGGAFGLLLGCPIYEDECESRSDCALGFSCDRFSQRCEPVVEGDEGVGCRRPDQCLPGETCTPDFACRPGSCDFHGCVTGYRCSVVDSAHACVPLADGGAEPADASLPGSPPDGSSDSGSPEPVDSGLSDAGPTDGGSGGAPADASP